MARVERNDGEVTLDVRVASHIHADVARSHSFDAAARRLREYRVRHGDQRERNDGNPHSPRYGFLSPDIIPRYRSEARRNAEPHLQLFSSSLPWLSSGRQLPRSRIPTLRRFG